MINIKGERDSRRRRESEEVRGCETKGGLSQIRDE